MYNVWCQSVQWLNDIPTNTTVTVNDIPTKCDVNITAPVVRISILKMKVSIGRAKANGNIDRENIGLVFGAMIQSIEIFSKNIHDYCVCVCVCLCVFVHKRVRAVCVMFKCVCVSYINIYWLTNRQTDIHLLDREINQSNRIGEQQQSETHNGNRRDYATASLCTHPSIEVFTSKEACCKGKCAEYYAHKHEICDGIVHINPFIAVCWRDGHLHTHTHTYNNNNNNIFAKKVSHQKFTANIIIVQLLLLVETHRHKRAHTNTHTNTEKTQTRPHGNTHTNTTCKHAHTHTHTLPHATTHNIIWLYR